MSKIQPKVQAPARRKRSYGPCFTVVCDDTGQRANQNILAYDWPSHDEIVSVAQRVVQQCINAYGKRYHWEPAEADAGMTGHLRGQVALAEAKRIVRDDPAPSAGQRFLLGLEGSMNMRAAVAKHTEVPAEPKRPQAANRTMLDRLQEPLPVPSGPDAEFDLTLDPAADEPPWEQG